MIGVLLLIPGVLQVPLPQADFHVIRHHHGEGEVCTDHDHLLRWHPHAGEDETLAKLHWHWLLPRSLDPSALDLEYRAIPALHAQGEGLHHHFDHPSEPILLSREDRSRDKAECEFGVTSLSLPVGFEDWPYGAFKPPIARLTTAASLDEQSTSTNRAQLARWNC